MNRSQRLQPVKDVLARREEEAARAMNRAARELQQAQTQLETLQRFRCDYAARLQRQGGSMSALQLNEYRAFLANLTRAIEEQKAAIQHLRQHHAALERAWRQIHCRLKGIDRFQDRLAHQERQSRERRLQAELDDRNAVRYRKAKRR